jgi:hypothetical protein
MKKNLRSICLFALMTFMLSFNSQAATSSYWKTTDAGTLKEFFPNNSKPLSLSAGSISTLYGSNNSGSTGGAFYFDITVGPEEININGLDINSEETGPLTLSVYKFVGTSVGNELNASLWGTPVTGTGVGAGLDNPSNVILSSPITLKANTTYAIALVLDATHGHDYTDGTGSNQVYSNSDLTISCGQATNSPFSDDVYTPRVWNGTIYYSASKPVPVSNWAIIAAMLLITGTVVIRFTIKRVA